MNEILLQLIDMLKTMSPIVWQTLIKQVYSEAFASLIWSIGLIVLAFCLLKLGIYGKNKYDEDDDDVGYVICYVFSFIGSGVSILGAFGLIISAIQYLFNPEFYAIKYILEQIK